MPKSKKTEEVERGLVALSIIKKYMTRLEITKPKLAVRLGISHCTLTRRFDKPSTLYMGEVWRIARLMNMSEYDKAEMCGVDIEKLRKEIIGRTK